MNFKVTVLVTLFAILLLNSPSVQSHSYVDCVDWRFKAGARTWDDVDGACYGYARRFPLKAKPFAKLDSDNPNRHYQQSHDNPDAALACSDGKQGKEPGANETMAHPWSYAYSGKDAHGRRTGRQTVTTPGGLLCVRWPAKNHAVKNEVNNPVRISISPHSNEKKDPRQQDFLTTDYFAADLNFKNCTNKNLDTDIWPCGGCFTVPEDITPGNHVMQWRWELNKKEFYTSCADLNVVAMKNTLPAVHDEC
jgi:hypothetical protein